MYKTILPHFLHLHHLCVDCSPLPGPPSGLSVEGSPRVLDHLQEWSNSLCDSCSIRASPDREWSTKRKEWFRYTQQQSKQIIYYMDWLFWKEKRQTGLTSDLVSSRKHTQSTLLRYPLASYTLLWLGLGCFLTFDLVVKGVEAHASTIISPVPTKI